MITSPGIRALGKRIQDAGQLRIIYGVLRCFRF